MEIFLNCWKWCCTAQRNHLQTRWTDNEMARFTVPPVSQPLIKNSAGHHNTAAHFKEEALWSLPLGYTGKDQKPAVFFRWPSLLPAFKWVPPPLRSQWGIMKHGANSVAEPNQLFTGTCHPSPIKVLQSPRSTETHEGWRDSAKLVTPLPTLPRSTSHPFLSHFLLLLLPSVTSSSLNQTHPQPHPSSSPHLSHIWEIEGSRQHHFVTSLSLGGFQTDFG